MSKQDLQRVIHKLQRIEEVNQKVFDDTLKSFPKVRIACVAAIIHWNTYIQPPLNTDIPATVQDFFNEPWVNDAHGQAEVLYIQRAKRPGDFWSGHMAFPGGKDEPADKNNLDTVIRECKEEIGLDLSTNEYKLLGTSQLHHLINDGVVTMTLVPHVFLKVTPEKPKLTLQLTEVAQTFWIPVKYLLNTPTTPYDPIAEKLVDANEAKKFNWPSAFKAPAIPLIKGNGPQLWGMTLRMTQDILDTPVTGHTIQSNEEDTNTNQSKL